MDKMLDRIKPINIEDEIRSSYLDYSMSVIVGRALPDVRDGLKPVHRRVLYTMSGLGNEWNKKHLKSARVVGDVMGRYHPHGDSAIYDALVRTAQPWSLRYPLADGQGNFGSVDGDPPAAMRYTEVRMSRITSELLADIDKDTVDWQPNYDESTVEPKVLPAKIPNLLLNGSSGIAVGMSTNIPPHNLNEVINATVALIDDPSLGSLDLMEHIPGPDFPTYGLIAGREAIQKAYTTGRGIITVRGRVEIEGNPEGGRQSLVITEIPYQLNKTRLIENIADLVRNKRIEGISDIRDESNRKGMRIVIEIKRDANPHIITRHLYKHTPLQSSFGIIFLAIVNGRPEVLTLKEMLAHFISHRKVVVTRRTLFELSKAEARAHILEGFRVALDNLDEVIRMIRAANSPKIAREQLMARFEFSQLQAQAVLDLRLQKLTGMERESILEEYRQIMERIEYLRSLLDNEPLLLGVIKTELLEIQEQYGDERRTEITGASRVLSDEDLIPVEDMVVTVSHTGYMKRSSLSEYRAQKRGGWGRIGMSTKNEDFVEDLFVASTHSYLLILTAYGRAHWVKVYTLPHVGRTGKGKPVVNFVELVPGDRVASILPVSDFQGERSLIVATRKGIVKRMRLSDFSRPRTAGVIAMHVDESDEIIGVRVAEGDVDVLLATAVGRSIRFNLKKLRIIGRRAGGVKGINLVDDDQLIGMQIVQAGDKILTVTQRGFGKRSELELYPTQGRGGMGVLDIKTDDRNGLVVGMLRVEDTDDVLLITDLGRIIRMTVSDIRLIGRNTKGVNLMRMDGDKERVTSVALVVETEEEEAELLEGVTKASTGALPEESASDESVSEESTAAEEGELESAVEDVEEDKS